MNQSLFLKSFLQNQHKRKNVARNFKKWKEFKENW